MLDHLDYEAMLPFQLFAAPILLFDPPVVGALTAFFYALVILLRAVHDPHTNVRSPSWASSGLHGGGAVPEYRWSRYNSRTQSGYVTRP